MTLIIALMLLNGMSHVESAIVLAFANSGFGSMPQLFVRDVILLNVLVRNKLHRQHRIDRGRLACLSERRAVEGDGSEILALATCHLPPLSWMEQQEKDTNAKSQSFIVGNKVLRHWTQRSRMHIKNKQSVIEGDNSFMDSKKSDLPGYAILDTTKGSITVELFKDSAPEVVDQFLDLCQRGRFSGMLFRHVIKHYVIQAGDSDKLGAVEDWTLKGKQYSQLDTSLKHEAFMLGTSKAKPDDKAFELFITTAPIPDLNEKLIVFGKVTKGEDIVQEIEEVDTDEHYRPKSSIEIRSVTLKQSI
ncbi:hypothetical protein V6N13_087133 [Hibiscus sabdariffa]|uniref:PPIase cyclophilin-type domain-containing protein n=1 Tax=Hibiscus sabdariffa TaxID=183260 RepID=A0ABR2FVM5_9ROSI